MQELIKIESVPAKMGANFEEVRARLQSELDRYDVLVTVETVPGAKKLATELNQTAKAIDERRKEEVAAVSEPIRHFDDQMKSLVTMCKNGRQKLIDQIQTFEDDTREQARVMLTERLEQEWSAKAIDPEFRRATIDGLVMLTAITKGGNLSAKSVDAIRDRVNQDKALQDRTNMRLLSLENASYKAGLSAPLTRDHVAGFLMAEDDAYNAELDRIIAAEIRREEEAQRRMRERMEKEQRDREAQEAAERARIEREQREREEREQAAAQPAPEPPCANQAAAEYFGVDMASGADMTVTAEFDAEPCGMGQYAARDAGAIPRTVEELEQDEEPEEAEPAPDKVRVTVTATFQPEVPAAATDEQIAAALRKAMEAAGITTLQHINITR